MKRRKIWILAISVITLVASVSSLFLLPWPQDARAQEFDIRYQAIVELTPYMIDACLELVDAQVSPTTYNKALAALYELEAQAPGSTGGLIPRMQEIWERVEQRNQLVKEARATLAYYIGWVTDKFLQSENPEDVYLALEWQTRSAGCFVHWADLEREIIEAQIDVEGVRTSLLAKVDAAKAAYERGETESAGEILCSLAQQLDDQDGVRIDPDSAALIRSTLFELVQRFAIPFVCEE